MTSGPLEAWATRSGFKSSSLCASLAWSSLSGLTICYSATTSAWRRCGSRGEGRRMAMILIGCLLVSLFPRALSTPTNVLLLRMLTPLTPAPIPRTFRMPLWRRTNKVVAIAVVAANRETLIRQPRPLRDHAANQPRRRPKRSPSRNLRLKDQDSASGVAIRQFPAIRSVSSASSTQHSSRLAEVFLPHGCEKELFLPSRSIPAPALHPGFARNESCR